VEFRIGYVVHLDRDEQLDLVKVQLAERLTLDNHKLAVRVCAALREQLNNLDVRVGSPGKTTWLGLKVSHVEAMEDERGSVPEGMGQEAAQADKSGVQPRGVGLVVPHDGRSTFVYDPAVTDPGSEKVGPQADGSEKNTSAD
jgi:hypothetical protein